MMWFVYYTRLQLGSVFTLVLNSAEAVKESLMKQSEAFGGRVTLPSTNVLSDNGRDLVFSDYNDSWKLQRRLAHAALFNAAKVRHTEPKMREQFLKLLQAFEANIAAGTAVLDPEALLKLSSLNIICSIVRVVFVVFGCCVCCVCCVCSTLCLWHS